MRILIISDDEHLQTAIEALQLIIEMEEGSITITDPLQADELISVDGYNCVLKNPSIEEVIKIIKGQPNAD